MTEAGRKQRNERMLLQVHPGIRAKVAAVLRDMEGHGWRPRIQQAHRSAAEQAAAVAKGASSVAWSFHVASAPDGTPEALAVDVVEDDILYASRRFFLMLASSAWAHELNTGTLWGLQGRARSATVAAVAARDFDAPVRIGWDAGHIEVRGITLAQAKRGIRPPVAVAGR